MYVKELNGYNIISIIFLIIFSTAITIKVSLTVFAIITSYDPI